MADTNEIYEPAAKKKGEMSFLDHIEELRRRLLKSIAAVGIMTVLAFIFSEKIFKYVTLPLGDIKLHFTEITGSFMAYFKISIYAGIVAASPIVLYQIWRFVAPGLYAKEKKAVFPLVFFSTILFLAGASFCFFVVLPYAIEFLVNYGGGELIPIITISSYITFAGMMMLGFGLSFELPVVGYVLGKTGIISHKTLSKGRPYAVVAILIVAAIITPTPDVVNQMLLAVPLYILFEVTILVMRLTGKDRGAGESKSTTDEVY
jgi:sec-independent protein translocase protein TatC